MKRLYLENIIEVEQVNEDGIPMLESLYRTFSQIYALQKTDEDRDRCTYKAMSMIRGKIGVNKILCFAHEKNTHECVLLTFDKEPDGKVYHAKFDENGRIYIMIEDADDEILKKQHTKELLKWLDYTRKFQGIYRPFDDDICFTANEIKAVLATREHVPNKKEAKAIRQRKAKEKR